MPGLGIGVIWFGYAVLYYGVTQVQGGNWGFLDLIVPARWTAAVAATPRDTGASAATGTAAGNALATNPAPKVYAPGPPTKSGKPTVQNPYSVEGAKPSATPPRGPTRLP